MLLAFLSVALVGQLPDALTIARDASRRSAPEAATAWERVIALEPSVEAYLGLSVAREAEGHVVSSLFASQEATRLAQAGDRQRLDECRARVALLKTKVGWLGLRGLDPIPRDAFALVGGERVPISLVAVSVPVDPGAVTVTWQAPGFVPQDLHAQLDAGKTVVLALPVLVREPLRVNDVLPPSNDTRFGAGPVALIVGGSLVSAAAIAGLVVTLSQYERFDQARTAMNPTAVSPPLTLAEEQWVKSAEFRALYSTSWVALGLGALSLASGIGWGVLSAPARGPAVSWFVGPSGAFLHLAWY